MKRVLTILLALCAVAACAPRAHAGGAFVTKAKWARRAHHRLVSRQLDAERKPVEVFERWDSRITVTCEHPMAAGWEPEDIEDGKRFRLPRGELEWVHRKVNALRKFEVTPGELAQFPQARVSRLQMTAVPVNCTWRHTLIVPHGTTFLYQPELTPTEVADGCIRPPAIVGSYAVRDEGNCKIAHIPRPTALGSLGKRVWGTITIERMAEGELRDRWREIVSFDRAELQTLTLPVTAYGLATFGYYNGGVAGGTSSGWTAGYLYAWLGTVSPASDGTATNISAYTTGNAAYERRLTLGIYLDSGGTPGAKHADTDGYAWTGEAGAWRTDDIDGGGVAVASGTSYWLVGQAEDALATYYDAGSYTKKSDTGSHEYTHGTLATPWPGTNVTNTNRDYSIYVTYSTGGGAVPQWMHLYKMRMSHDD